MNRMNIWIKIAAVVIALLFILASVLPYIGHS